MLTRLSPTLWGHSIPQGRLFCWAKKKDRRTCLFSFHRALDKALSVKARPMFRLSVAVANEIVTHGGFHNRFKVPIAALHIAKANHFGAVRVDPIEIGVAIQHAVGNGSNFCAGNGFFGAEGIVRIARNPSLARRRTNGIVTPVARRQVVCLLYTSDAADE